MKSRPNAQFKWRTLPIVYENYQLYVKIPFHRKETIVIMKNI